MRRQTAKRIRVRWQLYLNLARSRVAREGSEVGELQVQDSLCGGGGFCSPATEIFSRDELYVRIKRMRSP